MGTKRTELAVLEEAVSMSTGKSVDYLRNTPIDEQRLEAENRLGRRLRIKSYFPFIGRGNVLRDVTVTNDELEQWLDRHTGTSIVDYYYAIRARFNHISFNFFRKMKRWSTNLT